MSYNLIQLKSFGMEFKAKLLFFAQVLLVFENLCNKQCSSFQSCRKMLVLNLHFLVVIRLVSFSFLANEFFHGHLIFLLTIVRLLLKFEKKKWFTLIVHPQA